MTIQERLALLRSACRKFLQTIPSMTLDDLIQETWIATKDLTKPGLIVFKARQKCIDLYRVQKRRVFAPLPFEDASFLELPPQKSTLDLSEHLNNLIMGANLTEAEKSFLFRRFYLNQTLELIGKETGNHSKGTMSDLQQSIFKKIKDSICE